LRQFGWATKRASPGQKLNVWWENPTGDSLSCTGGSAGMGKKRTWAKRGPGQKEDRGIQLQRLRAWALTERTGQETLVLSDIGSGLSASRRPFQRLLKLVCEDKVAEVAITDADRLTRFGQEYLATLFACCSVTRTVLEPGDEKTPEQERTDDLLTLIASFSGRLYGRRSHKQKELVRCAQAVINTPHNP